MLSHFTFENNSGPYDLAILVKKGAMRQKELDDNYVKPLVKGGLSREGILALSLEENEAGKTPVSLIKEHLVKIEKVLKQQDIKHVLCTDASYFKVMCKVRKAEPHYGYVLPSSIPGVQVALSINYTQLFYNPNLKERMLLGIEAITRKIKGQACRFEQDQKRKIHILDSPKSIKTKLNDLLKYPALTCDIETMGLKLSLSSLASIAFAWNQEDSISFLVTPKNQKLLKKFFRSYKGKLIFHNATFDIRSLVFQLFMERQPWALKEMLEGLEIMFRNVEDTKILTYLAINSTAGNELDLKTQAMSFAGNYAIEGIEDVKNITPLKLLTYNATDAMATWYVYDKYREEVKKNQEDVYQQVFLPALKTITQMELVGLPMTPTKIKEAKHNLEQLVSYSKHKLKAHPEIQLYENKLRISMALEATAKLKKKVKTKEDYEDTHFNPRSNKQVRELLYDHFNLPVFRYSDTKLPSVDAKTLDALIVHLETTYNL
jgi:DNA polymerase-1